MKKVDFGKYMDTAFSPLQFGDYFDFLQFLYILK
jgi:hypothetical protein